MFRRTAAIIALLAGTPLQADAVQTCEDLSVPAAGTFIHFADQMPDDPQPIGLWLGNPGQTAAELHAKSNGADFDTGDPAAVRKVVFIHARILKSLHDAGFHKHVSTDDEKELLVTRVRILCMAFVLAGEFDVEDQYIIDERAKWVERK